MRESAAEAWESFRGKIPEDASPLQYRDMRRTFYLGMAAAIRLLGQASEPANTFRGIPPDYVISLTQELSDFSSRALEGRE